MRTYRVLEDYNLLLTVSDLMVESNLKEKDKRELVKYISYNSKEVGKNTLFVCKGENFAVQYLKDAIKDGAFCYISEKKYEIDDCENFPYVIVKDIRKAMAQIANCYYGGVWEKLDLVGITGTKGKTTTSFFVRNILDEFLKSIGENKSGFISGIKIYDGKVEREAHLTTPETFELHRYLDVAVRNNIDYFTMEVSSQALKYHRTMGIRFKVGCFLNIGEDHISDFEHQDFQDYFQSKLMIMEQSDIACINVDISERNQVIEKSMNCKKIIMFGTDSEFAFKDRNKEGDYVFGYNIKKSEKKDSKYSFHVKTDSFDEEFEINMLGKFNVSNALAAIAIAYALNIPLDSIKKGLKNTVVDGRMEHFYDEKSKINFIVDYAHNYMSFEALMKTIKEMYDDKKLYVVFGATGGKGKDRRVQLGKLAGIYADKIYVTEDDPAEEDLHQICDEIVQSVNREEDDIYIIDDREDAIRQAVSDADEHTVLVIAGRGVQDYQMRGKIAVPYKKDGDIVKSIIKGE